MSKRLQACQSAAQNHIYEKGTVVMMKILK
jgi:hypothetical protein